MTTAARAVLFGSVVAVALAVAADWPVMLLPALWVAVAGVVALSRYARAVEWLVAAVLAGVAVDGGWAVALVIVCAVVALGSSGDPRRANAIRYGSSLLLVCLLLASDYGADFSWSVVLAAGSMGVLAGRGFVRMVRTRPLQTAGVASLIGGIVFVASAGMIWSLQSAATYLRSANVEARAGLADLNSGETDAALGHFEQASRGAKVARRDLDSWLTQPARLIPVLAQHRQAVLEVVAGVDATLDVVVGDVANVDPDDLAPVQGRFDVRAIADLQAPMERILGALVELRDRVDAADSPWLVPQARRYLADFGTELDDAVRQGEQTLKALRMAPPMLGADGRRTYFVAFTTPSEIRGSLGFMGNWAEFTAIEGQVAMTRFGRTGELNTGGTSPRFVTAPIDWMRSWAPYGFNTAEGGSTQREVWSIISMSPQFPSVAQVMASLYPQSGGSEVDGVFAVDVDVLAALLAFTGPVQVQGRAEPVTADNARQFMLLDQYVEFDGQDRVDVIEQIARTTVERLLAGALPSPRALGESLSPLASQGRILAYATRDDEQRFFDDLSLTGDIRSHDTADKVVVSLNNASASKIDFFATGNVDYSVVLPAPGELGAVRGTLAIDVTNTAPARGYPDYVIGNQVGMSTGSSRLIVTAMTAMTPVAVLTDGEPKVFTVRGEAGLQATDVWVDVPPGGTRRIVITLRGPLNLGDGWSLTTRTPPTATTWTTTVSARDPSGVLLQDSRQLHGFVEWSPR